MSRLDVLNVKFLMKKNILLVSNYPSNTRYAWWLMEHFWCLLADEVIAQGGKAFIAFPKLSSLSEKIKNSAAKKVELRVVKADKELKKFIQKNNIRIVYFTDRAYFNPLYFFLRKWGVKMIIVHDHIPGDRPPVNGIKRFLKTLRNKTPFTTADAVLNVSELIRQRSIYNGCVPAHKTFTVQNGIEPISLCSVTREKKRRDLGAGHETTLVVTTGRAHPYKRFGFVIQVARFFKKRFPDVDVQFLLIGDGPQFSELEKMVDEHGLRSFVHLLGYRADIRELLQAGDIGFHASLGEAFSLSIVEYMSANMPVFVPDIPSVSQAVDHMKNGLIYPWDDPETAALMLGKIVHDRDLVRQMGIAARVKSTDIYNLDECSRQFLKIYRSLIRINDGFLQRTETP